MPHSVSTALDYWEESLAKNDQIHLLLLDFVLQHPESEPLRSITSAMPSGFDIASALELLESDRTMPLNNFCFKPLIAMVTTYADMIDEGNLDGSIHGCDVLLPKPLSANWARVLVEACLV